MEWFIHQKFRIFFSVFLASFVSLCLFYFMSVLIRGEGSLKKSIQDQLVIEFIRFKKDTALNQRKRALPKPPKQKPLPKVPLKISPIQPELKMAQSLSLPPLDFSVKGSGPGVGYGGNQSGGAIPLVRMQPPYPRKAALQRIEGWVDLKYDVTSMGTVRNIRVIKANPIGVFEKSATQAMMKWKFKPRIEDGQSVDQRDMMVRMEFKLGL